MSRANSEIIRAWADGSDIQYQQGGKWIDFDPTQLPWSMDRMYRVKPVQQWYRVGKVRDMFSNQGDPDIFVLASSEEEERKVSNGTLFLGWVSDRVYLETDE